MDHLADTDESFETSRDKLWPIVRNDTRAGFGKALFGTLQDDFNILFCHWLAYLPMHHKATVAI